MQITWLGHSCFSLESGGYKLVVDPYTDVPGCGPLQVEADAVFCSHDHFDHNYLPAVTLRQGGESPFSVHTLKTWHDDRQGALRGENLVHVFRAEGLTVVHLGDLGELLTDRQAEELAGCDALLLPIGGTYTIDAVQAKEVMEQVKPRVVIPMHYRGPGFGFDDIGRLEPFLAQFEPERIHRLAGASFSLDAQTPRQIAVPKR